MNTENLRKDLQTYLGHGFSQADLSRKSGVPQSTISQFVNSTSNKGISFEYASKLWKIIYGKPLEGHDVCTR